MKNLKVVFAAFMAILVLSCASPQVLLKENWIDERDVMALREMPMDKWILKAGRPTLVEIVGDTNIYYYNYRPTMYVAGVQKENNLNEVKPSMENATETWGSRRDLMQIKIVNGLLIQAVVVNGPDARTFIRDLNGDIILNPNSGYVSNISQDIKVGSSTISPAAMPAEVESPVAAQAVPVAAAVPAQVPAQTPAAAHVPAQPAQVVEAAHAPAHAPAEAADPAHAAEPPAEAQ